MYKQSPGRNHRSKGIKVKNVLQICLLLAICFWLIYQVKHSHDKKKEFDEDDTKTPIETGSSNEHLKLGRKDLLPRIEGSDTVSEKHREEPEDETLEEEEGNKPEEEDLEENNTKEKNDEQKEDGEDEVDDHDQEKSDVEPDQEEDVVDEDKERGVDNEKETGERREDNEKETDERGEDNEKETEERDSEVNDSQVEEENSLEDHDHDEDSSSSHEAREEHYKADDASSAVVTTAENDSSKLEQEAEHTAEAKSEVGVNNIMQINAGQNTTAALEVEDGKTVVDGPPRNTTNSEEKGDDSISSTARDISVSNSTKTEGLADNSESRTQAVNQEYNVTVGDTTSGVSNLSISSSQQNNATDMGDDNQIDSNLRVSSKNDELDSTPVDSSNVSGDTEAEKVVQGNATIEAVDNVGLPLKDNNATEVEKADTTSEEIRTTDEGVDASIAENLGEAQDDPIDTSDSSTHLEEKHIRTDVETLPEIQTEGNMEDAAAE
ncbi:uncharacterized protein LOC132064780 [Lycium ferocissimum]|uniref:uncharacterized protein LOC132064780 n=1 Tax=Lycium ferocissimum TaxID=112874 RepID=UPI002814A448|nr:uncharacterized protein LOC132064780 [Lycium ferocissimum]XP_059313869.1 uncharacterized protein LOC132064780 [Lycium ferocissimum]XP_059313870.1 uncharacterized protein LOC132064780 [Lycium ferocissimum]